MDQNIEVSPDEERLAAIAQGLGSVRTWRDFSEALALLAGRARNVQQLEGKPRVGETAPSDLTRCDEVLRALHYALTTADSEVLQSLHDAAVNALASAAGVDGRDAIGMKTGLKTRVPTSFGAALVATLTDMPIGLSEAAVVEQLAAAPVWRDCPFPRLRTLIPGHRLHEPMLRAWTASHWKARATTSPGGAPFARSLLEALGVSEAEALQAIPNEAPSAL